MADWPACSSGKDEQDLNEWIKSSEMKVLEKQLTKLHEMKK